MPRPMRRGLRRYVAAAAPERRAEAQEFADAFLGAQTSFAGHLLAALRDPAMDLGVRQAAVWFLRMLEDRRAVPLLLRIAQERGADPGLRAEAVQALGLLEVKRAAGPLVGLLLDTTEHEWVRRLAAQALGRLDDPNGRDALFRVVKDPEQPPGVRGDAAEALTSFQDARAVPALLAQLGDPSPEVRFWTVFALGVLGGPEVLPELERVAATDDGLAPGWWSVRKEALDAIRNIRVREDAA